MKIKLQFKGGNGSGNYGHSGRPGQIGGSGSSSGSGPRVPGRGSPAYVADSLMGHLTGKPRLHEDDNGIYKVYSTISHLDEAKDALSRNGFANVGLNSMTRNSGLSEVWENGVTKVTISRPNLRNARLDMTISRFISPKRNGPGWYKP